ncbi:hypothetical protein LCGC14_0757940 [marine sediment metagenome]|uniref:Uncharacterized protein n=1 Tax=marine sediment metagenome TaxID=412755 RepID=A0A0F9Q662_9ZZZZ
MIHNFVIIRDGLPLLVKNYSKAQKLFSQEDNLIMISGFFSALNSFSDSFEDLGTISELKLSNNDLKLSFLKDESIPNLIYLATFDEKTKVSNVQNLLRIISTSFLKKFNITQISSWNGRINSFNSFDSVIDGYIEEENGKNQFQLKINRADLFKDQTNEINEDLQPLKQNIEFNAIPSYTSSNKINPKYYLTGETSCMIYDQIDGRKSINQISQKLKLTQDKVYNICKNLIKMGFVSIKQ